MAEPVRAAPNRSRRPRRRTCRAARLLSLSKGGPNLRALAIYLRFTQGIAFERLAALLSGLLGLGISEGALVNILDAARPAFEAQTNAIRQRLKSGTVLQSDETGLRVGKRILRQAQEVAVGVPPRGQRRLRSGALTRKTRGGGVSRRFPARHLGPRENSLPVWRADGLGQRKSGLPRASHPRRAILHRGGRQGSRPRHPPLAGKSLQDRTTARTARRRHAESLRGETGPAPRRHHGACRRMRRASNCSA